MKRQRLFICWQHVTIAVLMLAIRSNAQPREGPEAIRPFRLQLNETYLDMLLEVERQEQKNGSSGISVTNQRILLQPVLGVGMEGSVYHSNMTKFKFTGEFGMDWQNKTQNPGGEATSDHLLQRYHGLIEFLRQKPYATSLFADKDLTYRDYDFFNRTRVDQQRFGVRTGYNSGLVPFIVSAYHREEDESELTRPSRFTEDAVSFNAHNSRRSGSGNTDLNYSCTSYTRQDDGFSMLRGLQQSLSVFNVERFGLKDWILLNSVLNYNSLENTPAPNDNILMQHNLRLTHSPLLSSFYEYSFSNTSSGPSDSTTHQSRVGLSHQLYESLTSTFDIHGNTTTSGSPGSSLDTSRYGVSINEQYTKRLSTWGRFTLVYGGNLDQEDRRAQGTSTHIMDEAHTLTDSVITYLRQLFVDITSVVVTDPTKVIVYQQGLDYNLIPNGALLEIRRIPGGLIPNGGSVLVEYNAALQSSARYLSTAHAGNIRLDLWNNLLGLYGRWNTINYYGGEQLILRTLDDKVIGLDTTWKWLRAGAEYEVADSNLTPSDRFYAFQAAQFVPTEGTSLGIDFDETWTTFRDTGVQQTSCGVIGRFQQQITRNLNWLAEAGMRMERGSTFDQDIATARAGLNWHVGKLTVKLDYQYNRESHFADMQERHYMYLRIRRTF